MSSPPQSCAMRSGSRISTLVEHDTANIERVSDRILGMVQGRVVAEGSFATVAAHPEIAPHLVDG